MGTHLATSGIDLQWRSRRQRSLSASLFSLDEPRPFSYTHSLELAPGSSAPLYRTAAPTAHQVAIRPIIEAAFAETERLYGSVLDGGRIDQGSLRIVALHSSVFYHPWGPRDGTDGSPTQLHVFLSTMPGVAMRGGYIDRGGHGAPLRLHRPGRNSCVYAADYLSACLAGGTSPTAEDAAAVLALMSFTETVLEPFVADLSARLVVELS